MADINNLELITDKIYQEGIERAEKDSKVIISKAETQAKQVLEEAKSEAHEVLEDAQREAERVKKSIENELRLKSKQLIADLKTEVHQILSQQIVEKGTKQAFADVDFLKSAIKQAISCWKPNDKLELILPDKLKNELDQAFIHSIQNESKDLSVTFSDMLSQGFRITEIEKGYQISFSEEDFNLLFSSYLQRQTNQLLFNQDP